MQKRLRTKRWFFRTSPCFGSSSPINNFKNVDFPTPFGPTMATRLLKSIPKSVLTNNDGCPSKLNVTSVEIYHESCNRFLALKEKLIKFHSLCNPKIGGCSGGGSGNRNLTT